MTTDNFFRVLFDAGEHTCLANTLYATGVHPVTYKPPAGWAPLVYFSINPMKPGSTRSDKAVIAYRNILIEADEGLLQSQYGIIKGSGLPYSTCVFSGNKSLHFIVSLAEPCSDRADYDQLTKRVYRALRAVIKVDTNCSNPSRSSRYPEAIRPDTGKVQHLLEVNARVARPDLEAWLLTKGCPPEPPRTYQRRSGQPGIGRKGHLRGSTLNFLMGGAPTGEWNKELFKAACDLAYAGHDINEAEDMLEQVTGSLDRTDRRTIASAYKRVEEQS